MKKLLPISAFCLLALAPELVSAQLSFTNSNSLLSVNTRSGCAISVVDVNNDGLDDIVRLDQAHIINLDLQKRDGTFENHVLADIGGMGAWSMTMADVDKNGWKDIVADGAFGINLVYLFETGGNITFNNTLLANSGFFLQNATFCDFNNDGWIDLFCCDDNAVSKMYLNDGAGNLNPSSFVNFAVNPGMFYNGDPYDSGNYGSAWIDFDNDQDLDLYVAHCRQSTSSPNDQRRINRLYVNDGNNSFTEMAANFGIDVGWQTWTSSFGDIDNDGDLDLLLTNHDHINQIYINDGTGNYTELLNSGVTNGSITSIESIMEDFDNDGNIDILISGSEWLYFKNNGNGTFTQVFNLFANNGMLSFATGDLNHDGFIDIIASYGNIYNNPSNVYNDVLYINNRNNNNFITFDLEGTVSEKGAIGSRVTIYGPWGVQIREVRAGESYGTCNSSQLHFGLGQATTVDSAVVWFTSGNTVTLTNLDANQFVTVVESGCISTGNVISGNSIICTGQSTTLSAASGFTSYNWSDGSTSQSVLVNSPGAFNVIVTDANGCTSISPNIIVELNPDETPEISTSGNLLFCEGGTTTLTCSPAASYLWSNGSTNQSINVTQTGNFNVTIQGTCASFTSANVNITVLDAPEPVATGAFSWVPAILTLTATGNNLNWYDSQTGGNLVGSGPTFYTPVISTTTTYWVDATTVYPGATNYTGMTYHNGTLYSGATTNGALEFEVLSDCQLVSVKVYTDSPGDREIELRQNGAAIQSMLVNIPMDTSRITLNFNLTPGVNYTLTTNTAVNNATLGINSPRLQRSNQGVNYPYDIPGLVSITGSNQGQGYYYYFYDWEVRENDMECVSDRVPAVADIATGINDPASPSYISVFPNPASDHITIENTGTDSFEAVISDVTGRVIHQGTYNPSTAGKTDIQLTGFAKGVYTVQIKTVKGNAIRKILLN